VITADGRGYEATGDGTGTLIDNPADIFAHLLTNFHLAEWKNGTTWLSTSSRIGASLTGSTGIVKTFLTPRMPIASLCLADRLSAYEAIATFCDNHGLRAYWRAGKLEFAVEDVTAQPYTGTPVDWDLDLFEFSITHDDIVVTQAVRVEHVHSCSQDHFLSSFGVGLPDDQETEDLSLLWSPSS
jgi:hypothetical protein